MGGMRFEVEAEQEENHFQHLRLLIGGPCFCVDCALFCDLTVPGGAFMRRSVRETQIASISSGVGLLVYSDPTIRLLSLLEKDNRVTNYVGMESNLANVGTVTMYNIVEIC